MSYEDDLIAREMDGRAAEAEESRAMQEHHERREHDLDMTARFLINEEGLSASVSRLVDLHAEAVLAASLSAQSVAQPVAQPTKPPKPFDSRPHSRACGIRCTGHGRGCHTNCPTCHGQDEF